MEGAGTAGTVGRSAGESCGSNDDADEDRDEDRDRTGDEDDESMARRESASNVLRCPQSRQSYF